MRRWTGQGLTPVLLLQVTSSRRRSGGEQLLAGAGDLARGALHERPWPDRDPHRAVQPELAAGADEDASANEPA